MRLTRRTSGDSTGPALRRLRFRLVVFLVRMWFMPAWFRRILPDPVILKRLRAPLLVFSFGILSFFLRRFRIRFHVRLRVRFASSCACFRFWFFRWFFRWWL